MASNAVLNKLRFDWRSNQRRLQKLKKKIDDHAFHPLRLLDCNHYLKEACDLRTDLRSIHSKIIDVILEDEATCLLQDEAQDAIYDLYEEVSVGLTEIQIQLTPSPPASEGGSEPGSLGGSVPGSASSSTSNAKLPRLVLPTFNGEDTSWLSFRDMFIATVHGNSRLSKAEKFQYLSTCLKGEAASIVNGLAPTDAHYDTAWSKLNSRYENKRQLFFSVMKKFHATPCASNDNPKSIRALVDAAEELDRALDSLELEDRWDASIAFHLAQKLDPTSRQFWEMTMEDTNIPDSKSLREFLEQGTRYLAASAKEPKPSTSKVETKDPSKVDPKKKKSQVAHVTTTKAPVVEATTTVPADKKPTVCKFCKEAHLHFRCPTLLGLEPLARMDAVKKAKLCENCLRQGHPASTCFSEQRCRTCKERHHTLLHVSSNRSVAFANHTVCDFEATPTILATAQIEVLDLNGDWIGMRAFIDPGASGQFITERAIKKLKLPRTPYKVPILGVSSTPAGFTKGVVSVTFRPWFSSDFSTACDTFIVPLITEKLPSSQLNPTTWPHLSGIQLADPHFEVPDHVDLLIGVDVFFDILLSEKIRGSAGSPFAVQTQLGWIVAGAAGGSSSSLQVHHTSLDASLEKFWELESVPNHSAFSEDEKFAEDNFAKSHFRNPSGRYVVEIPMRIPSINLGHSRNSALRRFHHVERRLQTNVKVKEAYLEFMKEYEDLGHMKLLSSADIALSPFRVFLPHHFVLKDEETMAKFRVVFDASAKTSSGSSFNDAQVVGPTIQATLHTTIMRFRIHAIAFTADIAKMYRQILVTPHQQHLQCILWRANPEDPVREYQLQTVTYGTASAPFLATRVLKQLALDSEDSFPLASTVAQRDFYVDDCLSGASTMEDAKEAIRQLRLMLESAGMSLRKFASNHDDALSDIPADLCETSSILPLDEDEGIKTLGLRWNTKSDEFFFIVQPFPSSSTTVLTKRVLLSEISRLFDPMGWLAPTVICSKILMQDLWKESTRWDDPVPSHIGDRWSSFKASMKILEQIRIPRCICTPGTSSSELHGFCDASEKAYSAVLYVRSKTPHGVKVTILTAKTKVAPVKTVSIPRLELCGSLLLAELIESTIQSLDLEFDRVQAWTDSMVVLDWLNSVPSRWKTFVANRVSKIQEILPRSSWSYISTADNPADCASRGIPPEDLLRHSLWWNGPPWLQDEEISTPINTSDCYNPLDVTREQKPTVLYVSKATTVSSLISKFSSLLKLSRTMAFCLRFISNTQIKSQQARSIGPLTGAEITFGLNICVKMVQREEFQFEVRCLALESPDMRGRLKNADISVDQRNPILLPRQHHLTTLILRDAHLRTLHGGPNLMLSVLQEKYWIIRARDAARFFVNKCVTCIRQRATLQTQLMGNLPAPRVNPSRPFTVTGVDFAGPFLLKTAAPRSKYTYKAYLSLFVCFSTRALHLEVVSSMTSEAFLACLKRFVSRRGLPSDIYSDNGTNFVGANREMKEFLQFSSSPDLNDAVSNHLSALGVNWHFNPPSAPHFGGLWEAGVKSVKFHLHRIVGQTRLTYEELSTVVVQIEACLNSRPLTPFSTDPTDLTALTPAHFLIGNSFQSIPEPDHTTDKVNRLKRWDLLQQMVQHFWKRWSSEFITRLQQRPKWMTPQRDIQKNDLVLVKIDGSPPTQWPLARVLDVHPGNDGISRVVTLRTATAELKRPIVKTVLLPIEQADSSDSLQF